MGFLLKRGTVLWLLPRMSQFFVTICLKWSLFGLNVVVKMDLSLDPVLEGEISFGWRRVCLSNLLALMAASSKRSRG